MPVDELRISRIKEAMAREGLDALICRLPENVLFLSGWWPLTGTSWVIFSRDGDCRLVIPACEAEEAQNDGAGNFSTYEWAHINAPDPVGETKSQIAAVAKNLGIDGGKIGIEENFEAIAPPPNLSEPLLPTPASRQMLSDALNRATFMDAGELINSLRVRKTPAELEKLRVANEIAAFGLAAFKGNIAEGVSEIELAAVVNQAIAVEGTGYKGVKIARGFAQVSSGGGTERGWRPFEITGTRKLQKGDIVLLELGAVTDGFWADNTRLAIVGSPSDKQKEIYDVVLKAQAAAIEQVRPGVKMSAVDSAARELINSAGLGDYFIHITGHGIGWRYHECPPLLAPGSDALLEEGMVSSVEPGLYIPGFGGMRVEDIVAVTKEGADVLSTYNREVD